MSSTKWLTQHEFSSPLKKIASSDELQIAAADDDIQNDFPRQQQQPPRQLDIWCSILIQNPSSLPPPYVHPLVKQSKSSLTMKSLEICTENLGSESGSDGFSSYPPSEISYSDNEEQEQIQEEEAIEEVVVEEKKIAKVVEVDNKEAVTLNYSKKLTSSSVPRSFPPPLNSLSRPGGGIQMKPHRKDGRLVLEAVSVPNCQNYFHAQRQDGRLVLTFASPVPQTKSLFVNQHVEEEEDIFETDEIEKEEEPIMEDEEEDGGIVLEMSSRVPKLPTGVINVHRSALMVNRFIGLTNNKNNLTTWSSSNPIHLKNKSEKMIIDQVLLPQSLPSPPTLAAGAQPRMSRLIPPPSPPQQTIAAVEASSFNTYEYCWRRDTSSMVSVSGIPHPHNQKSLPNTQNIYYNNNNNSNNILTRKNNYYINNNNLFARDSTVKGGKDFKEEKHNGEMVIVDHMVVPAYSKACKQEPRRAVLFWEPYCIATS